MARDNRWLEVRVENVEEAKVWLTYEFHLRSIKLRKFVDDVATYAKFWMGIYAPVDSGYTLEHIHQNPAHWHPGGFGGGGSWEAVVGVRRGTSFHPVWVEEGTGIYAGRGVIRPRHDRGRATAINTTDIEGKLVGIGARPRSRFQDVPQRDPLKRPALTFQKRGEPRRFKTYVRGQRPQPFVYLSFQQAAIYAETHARGIVAGGV